ncbi:MAG: DUF3099 domain-containing protein [Propioniciclava sp.]
MTTTPRGPGTQSVTTARESARHDLDRRRVRYLVTMGIRTACFVMVVFVDGWLRWVCVLAAVFLPFFAVVAAIAVSPRVRGRVEPVIPQADRTPRIGDSPYGGLDLSRRSTTSDVPAG